MAQICHIWHIIFQDNWFFPLILGKNDKFELNYHNVVRSDSCLVGTVHGTKREHVEGASARCQRKLTYVVEYMNFI